mgnify:FL=1
MDASIVDMTKTFIISLISMEISIWFWVGFNLFVLFMLALDL